MVKQASKVTTSFVWTAIKTLIVGLAFIALILTPAMVANASDTEEEYVTEVALRAATIEGPEQDAAMAELYSIVLDEQASPACRSYAEVVLLATTLLNASVEYPDSEGIQGVWQLYLEYIPTAKFDCEVAS